jgi:hypothetical protein
MTRDDVIDVLTVVAAATRRTVGEADVQNWHGIIGADDKQLALRAVRDHLAECPGVWLEPGHVHQRVRAAVRDQLAREPDTMREARQEALAVKAAEQAEELAGRRGIPSAVPTVVRPTVNPLMVKCPWCRAGVGARCVVPLTDRPLTRAAHPSRVEAALERGGA